MSERTTEYPSNLTAMTDAWTSLAGSFFKSATAANRAAVAAFSPEDRSEGGDEVVAGSTPSLEYEEVDWTFERTVSDPENLGVGDTVRFSKRLADEDVRAFARASGDTNRLHLDDEFAKETRFRGRIAHGTLASGLISAALARLPGLTIYLSQDLEFRGPVGVDDRVEATVEIVEDLGDDRYRLTTRVKDVEDGEGTVVVDGEAVVLIDEPPEE